MFLINDNYIEKEDEIPQDIKEKLNQDISIEFNNNFIHGLVGNKEKDISKIQTLFSNNKCYYFGHGTPSEENIKSIFYSGLRVKDSSEAKGYMNTLRGLDSTTILLGQGNNNLFKEEENLLNNWPHKDSKYIIIISLPYRYILNKMYVRSFTDYYESFYIGNDENGYYLRPEFIKGVYNANDKTFIENEKYYEKLNDLEKEELDINLRKKYLVLLSENACIPIDSINNLPLSDDEIKLCNLMWYKKELEKFKEYQKEKEEIKIDDYEIADFDWDEEDDIKNK